MLNWTLRLLMAFPLLLALGACGTGQSGNGGDDEPAELSIQVPSQAATVSDGYDLEVTIGRRGGLGEAALDVVGIPADIEYALSAHVLDEGETAILDLRVGPDSQEGTFDLTFHLDTVTERSSAEFSLTVKGAKYVVERYSPLEGELRDLVLDGEVITYELLDGLALFQGDIILGTEDAFDERIASLDPQGNVLRQSLCWLVGCSLWPNGTVPYEIAANEWGGSQERMESNIESAIQHWNEKTPLRLVPRTASDEDYVRFVGGQGCSSFLGRQQGMQPITLSAWCGTGSIIHEIGHAVGLFHEHTRADRDDHISVLWNNISSGDEHNFKKSVLSRDDGDYNYDSIMHYGGFGFSHNGQPTIETLPPGIDIGQRDGLSADDIETVASLYADDILNNAPEVGSFAATPSSAMGGEPVTFSWNVTDPDRDALTCRLDPDGDGSTGYEMRGEDCEGTNEVEHTYNNSGTYTATLEADDGRGGITVRTTSITVLADAPGGEVGSVAWQVETGDVVVSSPAIGSDGAVYVGSNDGHLYAVDWANGDILWQYPVPGGAFSSPAVTADGTVVFGGADDFVYAVDSSGDLQWRYETVTDAPAVGGNGVVSSPAIGADGTIYVGASDGYLYALSTEGQLEWRYPTGYRIQAGASIGANGTIYFGSRNGTLYALEPDGTLQWSYATGDEIRSSVAIDSDGSLYVGSFDGYLYKFDSSGGVEWRHDATASVYSSPAIGDGRVYVGSSAGDLTAIDSDTGGVLWRYDAGGPVPSSPALGDDGTVYVGSNNGFLNALSADGTLLWRHQAAARVYSSPNVGSNGLVYVGSNDGHLYAVHTASNGLAGTPWPSIHRNQANTGR